jgi:hypothetical protein
MAAAIQWGMGASLDRFHKGVGLAVTMDAAFPLRKSCSGQMQMITEYL